MDIELDLVGLEAYKNYDFFFLRSPDGTIVKCSAANQNFDGSNPSSSSEGKRPHELLP